ncbi:MAG: signal peptidase I [Cyanobacteria bacterium P01_H01_bin.121]
MKPDYPSNADGKSQASKQANPSFWESQRENIQVLIIALVLAFGIRTFVAEPRYIPSDSMIPTLEIGDRLVVEKMSYRFHPARQGDIVVFEPPAQLQRQGYKKSQAFIKRVIGEPGQVVAVFDDQVIVNNQPLPEAYIESPPEYDWGPYEVPQGELIVFGDNRNNSNDSHVWGFLPEQNIIGRACFRFWPLNRIGLIRNPYSS